MVLAQRFESLFRFDEGRAAFITLGEEVLWQSDERLSTASGSEAPGQGHREGIERIFRDSRTHEAYVVRETVTRSGRCR